MSALLAIAAGICRAEAVEAPPIRRFGEIVTARDAYHVSMLARIEGKLDAMMCTLTKVTSDNTSSPPELPNDITLPLKSLCDLDSVEKSLTEDKAIKNYMVRSGYVTLSDRMP